jgi:hypothetical protein
MKFAIAGTTIPVLVSLAALTIEHLWFAKKDRDKTLSRSFFLSLTLSSAVFLAFYNLSLFMISFYNQRGLAINADGRTLSIALSAAIVVFPPIAFTLALFPKLKKTSFRVSLKVLHLVYNLYRASKDKSDDAFEKWLGKSELFAESEIGKELKKLMALKAENVSEEEGESLRKGLKDKFDEFFDTTVNGFAAEIGQSVSNRCAILGRTIYCLLVMCVWAFFIAIIAAYPFHAEIEKHLPLDVQQQLLQIAPHRASSDVAIAASTNYILAFLVLCQISLGSLLLRRLSSGSVIATAVKLWIVEMAYKLREEFEK